METKEPPAKVRQTDPPTPLPEGIDLGSWHRVSIGVMREGRIPRYAEREWKPLWHTRKLDFLLRGFAVKEINGVWFLQQWLAGSPGNWALNEVGMNRLQAITSYRPPAMVQALMPLPAEMILPALPMGLEEKLLEYQVQASRQIFRALINGEKEWGYPGAWDTSDLGTGKTYQSLAAAIATGKRVGVCCPKSVIGSHQERSGWHGAFRHFGERPHFVINYESLRNGSTEWVKKIRNKVKVKRGAGEEDVETMRYEWTMDPDETLIVFDEAHILKNVSITRKMGMAAIKQKFSIICISGTMAAKPTNLGMTGAVVGLHQGDRESYANFLLSHGCRKIGSKYTENRATLAKHLVRIHQLVIPRRGARTRIADLGDRFPETQILSQSVETDETVAIGKAYEEAQAILERLRAQGMSEEGLEAAERQAYMKARKMSELAKLPAMVEMAREEIEAGRSVVLFFNFLEAKDKALRALGTDCSIHGNQDRPGSSQNRNEAIRRFKDDEVRVIVVMAQAGGTGVDLHDVRGEFPRTAIICPDNNAVVLGQVLGRVHRATGKSKSRQIIVYAAGTVEESICANVVRKLQAIDSLNDGELNPEKKF